MEAAHPTGKVALATTFFDLKRVETFTEIYFNLLRILFIKQ